MEKKQEVYELLREKEIPFEVVEHEPVYTIEDMERIGICDKGNVCKNLFLRDAKGKRHFLVCVRADKAVDLKTLGGSLGARLSFASEERLEKYLELKKGAVTPLGVLYDRDCAVEVVFDRDLQGEKRLGIHPCDNTATVFMDCGALITLIEQHGNAVTFLSL